MGTTPRSPNACAKLFAHSLTADYRESHGLHGVIIHKIDRSAGNLRDRADLGELIDAGIEVHFANESPDLNSRGGRLSADQARTPLAPRSVTIPPVIRPLSEA